MADWEDEGAQGQKLGIRHLPVERAGLYVPGGLGSYASTVIMNAVPALVAGVKELIVCTPPGRDGSVNLSVLAAARLMGIDRVFRVGGAQAIAAMAYGTETIPRVDVICGPGNAYVMEAKRQVYGAVGIDNLAGPSEVLVVADRTARPAWIAADMLAQEEHGSGAQAVLMADSRDLCVEVEEALAATPRGRCAVRRLGHRCGRISRGRGGQRAAPGADARPAPARAIPGSGPSIPRRAKTSWNWRPRWSTATPPSTWSCNWPTRAASCLGCTRPGRSSSATAPPPLSATTSPAATTCCRPVVSARFSSPLSVDTFMRKSSYVEMSPEAVKALTPHLAEVANSEGFAFHRISAELRAAEVGLRPSARRRLAGLAAPAVAEPLAPARGLCAILLASLRSPCYPRWRRERLTRICPHLTTEETVQPDSSTRPLDSAPRVATIERETRETKVAVTLGLDGSGKATIATGLGFFDHMLELFAGHGLFDVRVEAGGDLHTGGHHTVEDIGICLGLALAKAVGDKKGINRYGSMLVPMDESLVLVALDLSGRPYFAYEGGPVGESIAGFDAELGGGVLQGGRQQREDDHARARARRAATLTTPSRRCSRHSARRLRQAVSPDPRVTGIPSTKGVL